MEIRYVRNQWRMDDVSHLKVPVTLWQKRKERTRSNASGNSGIRPWPSRRQIQRTFPFFFLVLSNSTCVLIYRVLRPSFSLSLSKRRRRPTYLWKATTPQGKSKVNSWCRIALWELHYQNDVDDREKKTKTRRPTAAIAVVRRHRRARRTGGLVGRHPSLFQVLPRSASLAQRRVWTLESTWLERIWRAAVYHILLYLTDAEFLVDDNNMTLLPYIHRARRSSAPSNSGLYPRCRARSTLEVQLYHHFSVAERQLDHILKRPVVQKIWQLFEPVLDGADDRRVDLFPPVVVVVLQFGGAVRLRVADDTLHLEEDWRQFRDDVADHAELVTRQAKLFEELGGWHGVLDVLLLIRQHPKVKDLGSAPVEDREEEVTSSASWPGTAWRSPTALRCSWLGRGTARWRGWCPGAKESVLRRQVAVVEDAKFKGRQSVNDRPLQNDDERPVVLD